MLVRFRLPRLAKPHSCKYVTCSVYVVTKCFLSTTILLVMANLLVTEINGFTYYFRCYAEVESETVGERRYCKYRNMAITKKCLVGLFTWKSTRKWTYKMMMCDFLTCGWDLISNLFSL